MMSRARLSCIGSVFDSFSSTVSFVGSSIRGTPEWWLTWMQESPSVTDRTALARKASYPSARAFSLAVHAPPTRIRLVPRAVGDRVGGMLLVCPMFTPAAAAIIMVIMTGRLELFVLSVCVSFLVVHDLQRRAPAHVRRDFMHLWGSCPPGLPAHNSHCL